MPKPKKFPGKDEFVICTVKRLNPNSAEVDLLEYPGVMGMIHVSELANTWVKDIRKFIKPGQVVVTKVKFIDRATNIVNVSLKRVKANARRMKIAEYKNEKKAENFLKFVAKQTGEPKDKLMELLKKTFGQMYSAFEIGAEEGAKALEAEGLDKKIAKAVAEVAEKNIKPKEILVKGTMEIKSTKPEGVKAIRKVLDVKDEEVIIKYISAPKYSIEVHGDDYPSCEKKLAKLLDNFEKEFKKAGADFSFSKE